MNITITITNQVGQHIEVIVNEHQTITYVLEVLQEKFSFSKQKITFVKSIKQCSILSAYFTFREAMIVSGDTLCLL